jgi:glutamate-ammonia-ligase adenylyltransferase
VTDLRYDNLALETLAPIPFDDPAGAFRLLRDLGGHGVSDQAYDRLLAPLTEALATNADPDRALVNFCSWIDRVGSRTSYFGLLADDPAALHSLLTVFAASQYLSGILIRHPEYLELLASRSVRERTRTLPEFLAEAERRIRLASGADKKRDALRRFKLPEILRIGARDILGFASLSHTVTEISDFAEACVRSSLWICEAPPGFAVIGMGKLGGRELNYASDIDLVFVHDHRVDQAEANRIGEAVRDILSEPRSTGLVFRVDLRLRPEGRFGPISRSVESCAAYFESWAEPWERQAYLKARLVGGDETVGAAFLRLVEAFVFRKAVDSTFVEQIQANKRLIERQTARRGESESNVKQGVGGIRDVEFAVQLLQLIAGGRNAELRTGNTLDALPRLAQVGLLSDEERDALTEGYVFLRDVEHRLQIMDERPVRTIPIGSPRALDKFGRRLGYSDGTAFLAEYRRQTERVNRLFARIFYGDDTRPKPTDDIADWLRTIDDPESQAALRASLHHLGFAHTSNVLAMLRQIVRGTGYGEFIPAARENFELIASAVLTAASESGSPDQAFAGLERLAESVPSRAALYAALHDQPDLIQRLALLAGRTPFLWQGLLAHLELIDILSDDAELERPGPAPLSADAEELAAYVRRERIRIGARDILGIATTEQTTTSISEVADQTLASSLTAEGFGDIADDMAVIGLGKLGGKELGYGSDLDVLWVHGGREADRATALAMAATALLGSDMKQFGISWEIDARLRPDGRVGTLVRTVAEYEAYYRSEACQTWERQALIKARFAAGNASVGSAFVEMARRIVYESPIADAQIADIRQMKARIERERRKDNAEVKFGVGGLSDIEWTTQLLQWRHGTRWPKVRAAGTLPALRALRDAGVLRQDDWQLLSEVYSGLTAQRNHAFLRHGHVRGVPPDTDADLDKHRAAVRRVYERLFLGE